jgi:hypothetical protein
MPILRGFSRGLGRGRVCLLRIVFGDCSGLLPEFQKLGLTPSDSLKFLKQKPGAIFCRNRSNAAGQTRHGPNRGPAGCNFRP